MQRIKLRVIYAVDLVRFALFRARWRQQIHIQTPSSPNLRLAQLQIESGGSIEVEPMFATERQAGNVIWVQRGGTLQPEVLFLPLKQQVDSLRLLGPQCAEAQPRALARVVGCVRALHRGWTRRHRG